MITKSISHYRILEKLGEGGMGVVYKAEDTKLKRTVALKFLPAEMIRDAQAKKRFLQEAQSAAALDHPNICTIHEINEAEGQTYIAMAYVEGKSLKERLAEGPLAISEAIDIALQVAEGLKQAHGKGIIHRDVKPGNVMLTEEGRAKIMDFGLAKIASAADVTKTLMVMGTLAYMSPEQARGEPVDHRTDIWSFGAMFYEMVTGHTPFAKRKDEAAPDSILPDMPAVLHSILYDSPEPPSRLRKDLPRPAEQIILKALEKDRSRRYQSMDEVLKDLKAARSPQLLFPKPEKSIVVLPFEDMSPGRDNEYFSDGLTEEIITDLSHVHDLLVISRSSAMTFKGTKKKIKEIAQEVNVRYVLEGSVRKAGNNLRITAQLIDGLNDAHLWAEKYAGTLDDVFEIQEKVSRSIVDALKLKLTPEEKKKMVERPIEDRAAYEYYLRAKAEIYMCTEESVNGALRYLQNAIWVIGENALLYSGQAMAHFYLGNMGIEENAFARAEEYVRKALAIDPNLSSAHAVSGRVLLWQGDLQQAAYHLKKALALDPDDVFALHGLAMLLGGFLGRLRDAEALSERLRKIDPLDVEAAWTQGGMPFFVGNYERSLQKFEEFHRMWPENLMARLWYATALACCGRADDAYPIVDWLANANPNHAGTQFALFMKYALQGNKKMASEQITPEFIRCHRNNGASSYMVAGLFALLNEKEEAFEWLEYAVNRGFINYPMFREPIPFMASIRGEERFQKLRERVKKAWEEFEL